jgi:hypothetical protein
MSKILLITTAALIAAVQFGSSALASPLDATRAAAQAPDVLVAPIARRGGARVERVRTAGVRRANVGVNRNINVNRNRAVNRNVNHNVNVNRNVNHTVVRTGAWARPGDY